MNKKVRLTFSAGILLAGSLLTPRPSFAIEPFVVKEIQVQGLQRVELGTFFTLLPIKVGEVIDDVRGPMVIRGLFHSGSFSEIELAHSGNTLVVLVKERPVIAALTFDGNTAVKTKDLMTGLKQQGMAKGEVLNPSMLDQVKQQLEKQYFAFGKYGVKVNYNVSYLPRNRVNIRFKIKEGDAAKIAAIDIVGNKTFSDEDILSGFELSTGGLFSFFSNDNQYSKEKLGGDLEKLRSFYKDRGYLKFAITSTQVSITPQKDAVYITINISEGDKYSVSKLTFSGKPIISEKNLKILAPIKVGDTYSGAIVTFSQENISKALGRNGYAFANVSTIPSIDDKKHTVALNIFVDPGKRTYIRRISFAGNEKTDDNVMRREMRIMESGALSTDLVDRSKLRLERLPYFEDVKVDTKPVAGSDDQVDILYTVKERSSGSIGGGLGYSDIQGAIINANVSQNNFMGSGKALSFSLNSSRAIKRINVNYTDPYYTVDGISFGTGFFYSATDFAALNVAGQSLDRLGASFNYGIPLDEVTRLNFGVLVQDSTLKTAADVGRPVSVQIQDFFQSVGQDVIKDPNFNFQLLTASFSWIKNSLNRGIFPDRGTSQRFKLDFTLPVGNIDYYKIDYKIQNYIPITKGWSFLTRAQISFGDAYGSRNTRLPFFENFYAGGVSTMRGFNANTIGPKEIFLSQSSIPSGPQTDPLDPAANIPLGSRFDVVRPTRRTVGGNARFLGGFELIFPTPFMAERRSVRSSMFIDIGNVWDTRFDRKQFSFLAPSQLAIIPDYADSSLYRASYGLSVQWISPMGPLVFSFARPFRKQPGDRTQSFSFNIGRTF